VDAKTYGEAIASIYDRLYPSPGEVEADFLAALAAGGRALELGVGTGRVALPLLARGVEVHGVDSSPAMLAELARKPGGAHVRATLGDMTDLERVPGGPFALVYCVFNTFFQLPDGDAQLRCFASAARALAPGGAFVLDVFVPDLAAFSGGQAVRTFELGDRGSILETSRHDGARQRIEHNYFSLGEPVLPMVPVRFRYAWPSELDLMARLGGLRLRDRYADWQWRPFDGASRHHVSVYVTDPRPSR
jgi:SAM-dependent methyltransferase